jgi:glycine/D-amino acid oxidase-like deaminating enzyme
LAGYASAVNRGQPPAETDVVIVGGGIVGVSSAYELSKRGVRVTLLEKGTVAGEQSGRSWGFIRQQGRAPEELPLIIKANQIWSGMEGALDADIEWTQGGNLRLADDEATASRYKAWAKMGNEHGLGTQVLGMKEIAELLPGIKRSWAAGIFTPSDGHANPLKATRALAQAAAQMGTVILEGCAVSRLESAAGRITGVSTDRGEVRAPVVVLAAGAWSSRLASAIGVAIPQRLVRSTVALTEPVAEVTRAGVWSKLLAFKQTVRGEFLIAAGGTGDVDLRVDSFRNMRLFLPAFLKNREYLRVNPNVRTFVASFRPDSLSAVAALEPRPNQKDVASSLRTLQEYFPGLGPFRLSKAWAGNIDGTPDALPVVDAPAAPRGLVIATGLSGHGFGIGPAIGLAVADLVTRGVSDFDLHPMRLARFSDGTKLKPPHLL